MMNTLKSFCLAGLAATSLSAASATLAQSTGTWTADHAEYVTSAPADTAGTSHSSSTTEPNIMGTAATGCVEVSPGHFQSSEYPWSTTGAEIYKWTGTGTPASGFLCVPTAYAQDSVIIDRLAGYGDSSADVQQAYSDVYANAHAPKPNGDALAEDNSGNHTEVVGFTVVVPDGATVVNVPCDLSVNARAYPTSECAIPATTASASATSRAWVTF